MAYQGINTGTTPNDGLGDTLLDGGIKINSNFTELYNIVGDGTNTFVGVVTQMTAGTNVSLSTSYGSVEVSAPTPIHLQTDNLRVTGITTLGTTNGIGTVTMGVGVTALHVDGSARVTGVLTVGQSSITLENSRVHVGSGITIDGSNNTMVIGDNITLAASSGSVDVTAMTAGSATVSGHSTAATLASSGIATFAGNVSLGASLSMGDNQKILLGDDADFEIVHTGGSGNVIEAKTAALNFKADNLNIVAGTANTVVAATNPDGNYGIEFYYLNDKKIETRSSGIRILGGLQVVSGVTTVGVLTATTLYGDGSNLTGIGAASTAHINADTLVVTGITTLGIVTGATYFGDGSNLSGIAGINTTTINTTLFNNSGITTLGGLAVVSSGATITGVTTFNSNIAVGGNLNIGSNTSQALIQSTASDKLLVRNQIGSLDLWGNTQIRAYKDGGTELMFRGIADGAFEAYHDASKKFETTSDGAVVTGILTATSFEGNASNITSGQWTLGAQGSSHYLFTGPGVSDAEVEPVLYLARGQRYEFVNNMNAHPFEIRVSNGGAAYTNGITVDGTAQNGTTTFEVPFNAPNSLYYQCTSHAGMGGTVVVYPNLFTV